MAKAKGWIKVYRSIEENVIWADSLRVKAWLHLMLSANHKDGEWVERGNVIHVKKGQFVTSLRKLSDDWGCNIKTVRRILIQFTEMGMINYETCANRYTLVTVIKYSDYQDGGHTEGHSEGNGIGYSEGHSEGYTEGTQTRIYKNNKNYKNDKEQKKASPVLDPGGYEIEE